MTAPSITEFLLARIAEDEAYLSNDLNSYDSPHTSKCNFPGDMTGWCDCGLRDKLLAECAAKRAMIEHAVNVQDTIEGEWGLGRDVTVGNADKWDREYLGWEMLQTLAAVYASHPDYQHEWTL